ncbi:MAG: guanylate kinase [Burkholderiales bacterium]|jgi:guanylate kinase|nr:guanylate kinase [Burkholderiales bacterium]
MDSRLFSVSLGCLFVLAAPSGAGKTSLVHALLAREPSIRLSVSYTTRQPRQGEENGVHYHFVDQAYFDELSRAGEFLESAHVYGNWYATSATWIKSQIESGQDVLLEIDWQGAKQVRKLFPDSIQIFILPPSLVSLQERLEKRGQDSADVISRRMDNVREEFCHYVDFDYVIINQNFTTATADLVAIVRSARLRAPRQHIRHARLLRELIAPIISED